MADDLRTSDPVADLVDSATGGGEGSAEEAIDVVTQAREGSDATPEVEYETEGSGEGHSHVISDAPKSKRMTKAEALAQLAEREQQLADLNKRMQALEARTNTSAVDDLGATFALAIQLGGQFLAAQRGPHWQFEPNEARPIGDAWAVVAAPYASKLKTAVPWALAIGVTWKSLQPRLAQDKILATPEGSSDNES